MKKLSNMATLAVLIVMFVVPSAWAFEEPSSGSFGYEVYDFVINNVFSGAIGVTLAMLIFAYGIFWILRSQVFGAVTCLIAAIFFFKLKDIVLSLGVEYHIGLF